MCATVIMELTQLETETCSRCGGSGEYSYCQMYGTRCFKCHGRKIVFTKRGAEAARYLEELRSKPADELKVGDIIRVDVFKMKTVFEAIESIEAGTQEGSSMKDGVMVPYSLPVVTIRTGSLIQTVFVSDSQGQRKMFRIAQSKEQKAETFRKALEYQATLTKAGTVRKR